VSGTTAQQFPFFRSRLRRAMKGTTGPTRQLLRTLLEWNGDYDDTRGDGTVSPGVAIWEEFKDEAERIALFGLVKGPLGPGALDLAGNPGSSHAFDISNGEAYALRALGLRGLRLAAERTHKGLASRFRHPNPDTWREPRRMYDVSAQGAAATPELPFYDRGTWQQSVGLGP
jgi:hypothetical protein